MGEFPGKGRSEWSRAVGKGCLEEGALELPWKDEYLKGTEAGRKFGVEGTM